MKEFQIINLAITPEQLYTSADLNYNDSDSRSIREQRDAATRPAISGSVENMKQYDIVFWGYPIWNGQAPKIISTFLESYDFSGKTVIPFSTHGGSSFAGTPATIQSLEPGAKMLDGLTISRNNIQDAEQEIVSWVNGLDY